MLWEDSLREVTLHERLCSVITTTVHLEMVFLWCVAGNKFSVLSGWRDALWCTHCKLHFAERKSQEGVRAPLNKGDKQVVWQKPVCQTRLYWVNCADPMEGTQSHNCYWMQECRRAKSVLLEINVYVAKWNCWHTSIALSGLARLYCGEC